MKKQITEEQVDLLVERLLQRVYDANTSILQNLGNKLDEIHKLTPTDAYKMIQMLKYGGEYDKIVSELDKYTTLNIKDIDKIFKEYAKKDAEFYEQFYKYREIPYVEYENNTAIRQQTEALAGVVKNELYNYTRSGILGYTMHDIDGRSVFKPLKQVYNDLLDTAFMNVGQGKETFDGAMSSMLRDIGGSGLKTIQYQSGRSVRLDSVVRMHLKDRLAQLHNENQKIYGREFDADGYEISVHLNPAVDHENVQGRQFSLAEYDRLDSGLDAKDVKGNTYSLDEDGKNGYRPIGTMNCYHYIFPIVLGVSEPEYSDQELQEIKKNNHDGFVIDGKHYTNYEGTQLQRSIERKIREQKDIQILARASNNDELISEAQKKIRMYTNKYNEVNKVSGLPSYPERMRVKGYKRVKVSNKK